jgi:hypothetical protein
MEAQSGTVSRGKQREEVNLPHKKEVLNTVVKTVVRRLLGRQWEVVKRFKRRMLPLMQKETCMRRRVSYGGLKPMTLSRNP